MNWKQIQIEYNLFLSLKSFKSRKIVKIGEATHSIYPKLRMFWKKGLIMKIII